MGGVGLGSWVSAPKQYPTQWTEFDCVGFDPNTQYPKVFSLS